MAYDWYHRRFDIGLCEQKQSIERISDRCKSASEDDHVADSTRENVFGTIKLPQQRIFYTRSVVPNIANRRTRTVASVLCLSARMPQSRCQDRCTMTKPELTHVFNSLITKPSA